MNPEGKTKQRFYLGLRLLMKKKKKREIYKGKRDGKGERGTGDRNWLRRSSG